MSGNLSFHGAAAEVGKGEAVLPFALGHMAFAEHRAETVFPEHLAPGHDYAKEQAAEQREQFAATGEFLDWMRATNAHLLATSQMNHLMTTNKLKTQSYLDFSPFAFPAARKAANTPVLNPAMMRHAWLDTPNVK